MSIYDYERLLLGHMESLRMQLLARPLNLGGVASTDGGSGGPPGGFVGYLPQTRVAYDQSEVAVSGTSVSGSLLDNLNHIRYRLQELESNSVVVVTSNYNVTDANEIIVGNSVSGLVIALPAATGTGNEYRIKNINSGTVTISGNNTETIDSLVTQNIYQWESVTVVDYTAGGWIIL